jgi:leucyl-tRNA synthetase
MFLGPHEASVAWNDNGVVGVQRFLERVWNWGEELKQKGFAKKSSTEVNRALHKLTKKITDDLTNYRFNTAVSSYMEFHNSIKTGDISEQDAIAFLCLLHPFAPHVTDEIASRWGHTESLETVTWPKYDPKKVIGEEVEIVVQIGGRLKGRLRLPIGSSQSDVETASRQALIGIPKNPSRTIFVTDRLINFVE